MKTGGDWFFVAAVSCVFGLSILFAPYVVTHLELPDRWKNKKGVITLGWDTFWLYAIIVACGFYVKGGSYYWQVGLSVTTYCWSVVWVVFVILRYLKANVLVKTGLSVMTVGTWIALVNDIINVLSGTTDQGDGIFCADFSQGFQLTDTRVFNANVMLTVFISSILLGGIMILLGIMKKKDTEKEKQ